MMAKSTNALITGRIRKRKINPLHRSTSGLQHTAGPYSRVESRRDALKFRCPLYPRKQTFLGAVAMSALGPCVDGSELARTFFTSAALVGTAMCSAC